MKNVMKMGAETMSRRITVMWDDLVVSSFVCRLISQVTG